MEDGRGRCGDCAMAIGHLGVLAEALSGGVGDWEARLVEADEAEWAQQAAHIRGLLARAAEELDGLAADLAKLAYQMEAEEGASGGVQGGDAHHLDALRRAHPHELDEPEAAVLEPRWQDATVADLDADEEEADADLVEAEFERHHRLR